MSWIKNILQNKKILALAPMADMTDSPFCQTVKNIGGCDVVFREMVSAEALVRDSVKTIKMTDFVPEERPIVQQIFGSDALTMARAAAIVMEHAHPEGIDINMGCPVYKITSNFNGCALMKEPERAAAIVREIKKAIGETPLSVKIRLGWSDPDEFKKFIPVLEDAGVDLITVHGRTKAQGYSGKSDWARIAEAKKISHVPLLTNGDVHEPLLVQEALQTTGADGVMIGRGALGNPWFFKLAGQTRQLISLEERVQVILAHARLHVAHYGERSMVTFRKHLSWYFKTSKLGFTLPHVKNIREKLVRVSTINELELIFSDVLKEQKNSPISTIFQDNK